MRLSTTWVKSSIFTWNIYLNFRVSQYRFRFALMIVYTRAGEDSTCLCKTWGSILDQTEETCDSIEEIGHEENLTFSYKAIDMLNITRLLTFKQGPRNSVESWILNSKEFPKCPAWSQTIKPHCIQLYYCNLSYFCFKSVTCQSMFKIMWCNRTSIKITGFFFFFQIVTFSGIFVFPCISQTQLSAMHLTHLTHLTHLHMTTMAPSPVGMRHRLKDGEARKQGLHSQHDRNQDEDNESKLEKWPSAIPNLLHVPEKRRRFRSRNVISLVSHTCVWSRGAC